jgi:hypothetical protein
MVDANPYRKGDDATVIENLEKENSTLRKQLASQAEPFLFKALYLLVASCIILPGITFIAFAFWYAMIGGVPAFGWGTFVSGVAFIVVGALLLVAIFAASNAWAESHKKS